MSLQKLFGDKHFQKCAAILAFSWFSGLFVGCIFGAANSDNLRVTILSAGQDAGFFQMIPARLFVPMVAAFLTYISKERWIYLTCFLRMFLFGHTVFLIRSAFGTSSWLVNSILMLPSALLLAPTFWFCLRRLTTGMMSFLKDITRVLLFTSAVTAFDSFLIAPFLETVL